MWFVLVRGVLRSLISMVLSLGYSIMVMGSCWVFLLTTAVCRLLFKYSSYFTSIMVLVYVVKMVLLGLKELL